MTQQQKRLIDKHYKPHNHTSIFTLKEIHTNFQTINSITLIAYVFLFYIYYNISE